MGTARRPLRSLAIGAAVIGGTVTLVALVLASLFVLRDRPGARSFDDALEEFRSSNPDTSDDLIALVRRPPPGVYLAEASGSMSISFPPTSQEYGATAPVTIRHVGDRCWATIVDFNSAFQQQWDYCITEGTVTETSNRTTTRWDLGAASVTNTATFECAPPGEILRASTRTGDRTEHECTGSSDEIDGITISAVSFEALGPEELLIGGRPVQSVHFREVDLLSGAQRGSTTIDFWYSTEDMLLLGMARRVDLRTASPVGDITYKENGSWTLMSRDPSR